jgi:NADH dehydrogenase
MILVVGATGLLGGTIAQKLLAQGKQVRILARHNSPCEEMAKVGMATSRQALVQAGAEVVYGDMKDPASLEAACQGIETLIATANSVLRGGPDTVESVDLNGNLNLIAAAKQAGIKRFIFVSQIGASPDSPIPFQAAKAKTEQALRESGMDYTILAPNAFLDIWATVVVGMPLLRDQLVTLVEPGTHRHSFVAVDDVARLAVAAVDNPAARNTYLPVAGPQAISWRDIVSTYESVTGCPASLKTVRPGETIPGQPDWVNEMLPAFEMFDSIIDTSEVYSAFGVPSTSLEAFVRQSLLEGQARAPGR